MPKLSLVVCVFRERSLLERLLRAVEGLYDDLVVVHDGSEKPGSANAGVPPLDFATCDDAAFAGRYPAPECPAVAGSVHELVHAHGGRFFEGPRCFQQEPHWPFAWRQARHDWILRLDADEFPSLELVEWLRHFRGAREEPPATVSGYTCLWPLWDGRQAVTKNWPGMRVFLLHRLRVRSFGMAESVPIPDSRFEPLDLVLHHQPLRKSYGVRNIVLRKQAYAWRRVIARSLMSTPMDLPRWRWDSPEWPPVWEHVRQHPLRHAISSLIKFPVRQFRGMLAARERPLVSECLNPALHHFLLGLQVLLLRMNGSRSVKKSK